MAESRYLKNRIEKRLPHFFDDAFLLMVCKMHFLEEFEIKDVTTIEFEEPVFFERSFAINFTIQSNSVITIKVITNSRL